MSKWKLLSPSCVAVLNSPAVLHFDLMQFSWCFLGGTVWPSWWCWQHIEHTDYSSWIELIEHDLTLLSDVSVISTLIAVFRCVLCSIFHIREQCALRNCTVLWEKGSFVYLAEVYLVAVLSTTVLGWFCSWRRLGRCGWPWRQRERIRVSTLYLLACQSARLPIYHPFAQEQQMIFGIQCHCWEICLSVTLFCCF